jgi:hypothetical protein
MLGQAALGSASRTQSGMNSELNDSSNWRLDDPRPGEALSAVYPLPFARPDAYCPVGGACARPPARASEEAVVSTQRWRLPETALAAAGHDARVVAWPEQRPGFTRGARSAPRPVPGSPSHLRFSARGVLWAAGFALSKGESSYCVSNTYELPVTETSSSIRGVCLPAHRCSSIRSREIWGESRVRDRIAAAGLSSGRAVRLQTRNGHARRGLLDVCAVVIHATAVDQVAGRDRLLFAPGVSADWFRGKKEREACGVATRFAGATALVADEPELACVIDDRTTTFERTRRVSPRFARREGCLAACSCCPHPPCSPFGLRAACLPQASGSAPCSHVLGRL